jgi:hypothetical protein
VAGSVLVVAAEGYVARLVEVNLRRAGCEVRRAETAAEAFDLAVEMQPDLLVLSDAERFAGLAERLAVDPRTSRLRVLPIRPPGTSMGGGRWTSLQAPDLPAPGFLLDALRRLQGRHARRVLLLARDPGDRRRFEAQLLMAGHGVMVAMCIEEAFTLAVEERPDVIIVESGVDAGVLGDRLVLDPRTAGIRVWTTDECRSLFSANFP